MPAGLQKQTLLRIHALGFGRRDVEKQGVEAVVIFQRPHPLAVALARYHLPRLIEALAIPTISRNLTDAIPALRQILPKLFQIPGLRKLPRHPYHCDGG